MKKQLVLGIMSGTSLGTVDYALCEIGPKSIRVVELWEVPYPKPLQARLHAAARGAAPSWEFCQLHHDLGRFYAEHAAKGKQKPALVGLHGQTVFHNPDKKNPATFQLGEPSYLVEKLGATVVNNFRAHDMAVGGQGAPLATVFHEFVFGEAGRHVCVNNLGGISNVTSLDARRGSARILAFDTGPANMLMDFAMRHFSNGKKEYDAGGRWAMQGNASEKLVAKWLQHPYFKQKPPKSTGRELFGEPFFQKVLPELKTLGGFDAVATLTEFTAQSLALNYKRFLPSAPDRVILTGGGASNPVLFRAIANALEKAFKRPLQVISSEDLGWSVQSIEPAAFALLAWLRWSGRPGNIPATTGARTPVLCGQISA